MGTHYDASHCAGLSPLEAITLKFSFGKKSHSNAVLLNFPNVGAL